MAGKKIELRPVGLVKTDASEKEIKGNRKNIVSRILIDKKLLDGLDGIEDYSHIYVIFWMHRVPQTEKKLLKLHPRGRMDLPKVGVFATRARAHPNNIGLAVVELLERRGGVLMVRGLDAIDGTPVIDVKPYDPHDIVKDVRVPGWWLRLKEVPSQKCHCE